MRAFAIIVFLSGCDPLGGFTVEDHRDDEVAVLPMRCLDSVARTSGGLWVCRTEGGVFASRGDALSVQLSGEFVAVAGSAVWTWGSPFGAVLVRYEDDSLSGGLVRSPDAGFDWKSSFRNREPIQAVLAHERNIVLGVSDLQVIAVGDGGFELLSTTSGTFLKDAFSPPGPPEVLFQVNEMVWASGPQLEGPVLCGFNFSASAGITSSGQCARLPANRLGPGSGGLWLWAGGGAPTQFYRPAFGIRPGIELPRVTWSFGAVPWTTPPDSTELIVPRVEGDRLVIDRYEGSAGNVWAGANESWVYEVGTATHVRAR
jgi:hypothetical protein